MDRSSAPPGAGFLVGPALAIIELGINDCQDGAAPSAFAENLRKIVSALRAAHPNCSVVLVASNDPTRGMTRTFDNAAHWPDYVAAMRGAAESETCALIDFQARWGSTALEQGFVSADNPHPNAGGHADMARAIASVVLAGS